MRLWHSVALFLFAGSWAVDAQAQGTISSLPRKETLIVENPEGTIKNAGWFNIWAINAGGQSTGLHHLDRAFGILDDQRLLARKTRDRALGLGVDRHGTRQQEQSDTMP